MSLRSMIAVVALAAAGIANAAHLLNDTFTNPDSGWPNMAATRNSDLGFAVYTDSGKYQLTPVQDQVFGFIAAPRQAGSGDVKIASDLFLYAGLGAGAGGLGCRHQDHRNFYAFMARGDGTVMILKVKDGNVTPLAKGKVKQVMPGAVDTRFAAQCKGDTLRLTVKDGDSISATDGDFSEGQSGVFVIGEKLAGTSVAFDNFSLEQL